MNELVHLFFFCRSVAQAYLNQKRLDAEAKQLHTSATQFSRQTQQWMHLIEGFSSALKVTLILVIFDAEKEHTILIVDDYLLFHSQEIGDVENWAKSMENDMMSINETLNMAYKKNRDVSDT